MPIKMEYDYTIDSQYPRLDNEMKPVRPDMGEARSDYQFFHITILFIIYLETSFFWSVIAALELETRVQFVLVLLPSSSHPMFLLPSFQHLGCLE